MSGPGARDALKHGIERLLRAPAVLSRRLHRGRTIVLAYHNVVPDGERVVGDRSLHIAQRAFARQLDLLAESHDVIPLVSALSGDGSGHRPRAVITFDDAYAGAITAGIEELTARRMPATIFVAPGLLDGKRFWWDECADPELGGLSTDLRTKALTTFGGDGDAIRAAIGIAADTPQTIPLHATGALLSQVRQAADRPGVSVGSHTWSHPNLSGVPATRFETELKESYNWLSARFQTFVPWLAYPYGLTSPDVARAVRAAGYVGAFRVEGGWLPPSSHALDPYMLPRFNVPSGLSLDGFAIRIAGLLPA